jgi:RHS repeat-associated protein
LRFLSTRHTLGILSTTLALSAGPRWVEAQTCPDATVTVNISVGDRSTPSPQDNPQTYITAGNPFCQTEGGGWGSVTLTGRCAGPNTVTTFSQDYLTRTDPVFCTADGAGCLHCTPTSVDAKMYASSGSFKGTVFPAGQYGGNIYSTDGQLSCGYGSDGKYDCAQYGYPPANTNNWYVAVSGDGHSDGHRTVTLVGPGGVHHDATTRSSFGKVVNWIDGVPVEPPEEEEEPVEEPVEPGCDPPPTAGPPPAANACGAPVSVTSGNAYFSHVDAAASVIHGSLQFVRSYNSVNRGTGLFGVFGPGWHHTYEQNLTFPGPGRIKLRRANGRPSYFADPDGDLRYDPTVPFTAESWIQKQTDGSYVRQFRKGGSETYDSDGRLLTIADALGNTTVLAYNGSGQLTTITGPGGRALTLTYAGGKIAALSGPSGTIATYGYDGSGRLSSVQYADGAASGYTFTYDASTGAVASVADLTGRTIETHAYDAAGRAYTSEISGGQERYVLSFAPNATTVTDALGHVTTYEFASIWSQKLVTRIIGPCQSCAGNESREWTYDDKARILTYKDGNGKVTSYTYEPDTGDLLTVTDPLSNTTTYTYDTAGRVLTRADAAGGLTTYTPSAAGPTSITETLTPSHSRTTSIAYRSDGLVGSVTDPRGKTTVLSYNATGDLSSSSDPLSHVTQFEYDAFGRRTKVTDPLLNATQTAYDIRGLVTRVTDAAGKHTDFGYDAGGRRTSVTDALGRSTQYAYDAYGRLSTVTDTMSGVTQYGYDAMSNLVTLTDAKSQTTTFDYDVFGRVKKVTYPGGAFEMLTYDPGGRLSTRTDRRGVVTTYAYDDAARLTGKTYSDATPPVTFSYDPVGRLLTAANGTDALTWTYDLAGQMLSEASAYNSSLVENVYDDGGNRLSVSLNGSVMVTYAYDDASRLASVSRGTKVFTFGYDDANRRTSLSYPDGVATSYAYDAVSRLTSLAANRGATPITNFGYTYDDAGNRVHKSALGSAEDYSYDPLYRLTQVVRNTSTTEAYTYDPVGNRLSSLSAPTWTYNARNELLSQGGTTYTYDANGNLSQKVEPGATWSYTWNAENQLTAVTKNGVVSPVFLYDPRGRRVKKGSTANPVQYTYDGEDILIERRTSTDILMWVHGPGIDEPLASQNTAPGFTDNWKYRHLDGLGSLVTTIKSGAIISTVDYDAFGNGGTVTGYGYTGREFDPETGLLYYRARYYDPKIGRFLSEDPIRWRGLNSYSYARANPVRWKDPLGLWEWPAWEHVREWVEHVFDSAKAHIVTGAPNVAITSSAEAMAESGGATAAGAAQITAAGNAAMEVGTAGMDLAEGAQAAAMGLNAFCVKRRAEYCSLNTKWCGSTAIPPKVPDPLNPPDPPDVP